MTASSGPRLLGDIGGTNARFAWQPAPGSALADVATYPCAEHASLHDAIRHYLGEHARHMPGAAAIGIANPITGDQVRMTNHDWSFSIAALQRELGLQRLLVLNDFSALALSLPALGRNDLHQVGAGQAVSDAPMGVLGPGTGLGVSGLMNSGAGTAVPISGEGGHVTLAAADDRDAAVLQLLRQRFGHVSAERALSGPGLVNLHDAACLLTGRPARPVSAATVIADARNASDDCCVMALDLFCGFLGGVAGNLALTLGARGGIFIGGGMAPRFVAEIEQSRFRERFESKGRFGEYLKAIPTFIIDAAVSPALTGAARALDIDSPLRGH